MLVILEKGRYPIETVDWGIKMHTVVEIPEQGPYVATIERNSVKIVGPVIIKDVFVQGGVDERTCQILASEDNIVDMNLSK